MDKVRSVYEQYVFDRNKKIVDRYKELTEAGTGRMVTYNIIGNELTPPINPTTILRILKKNGIEMKPTGFGRPAKFDQAI